MPLTVPILSGGLWGFRNLACEAWALFCVRSADLEGGRKVRLEGAGAPVPNSPPSDTQKWVRVLAEPYKSQIMWFKPSGARHSAG